MKFLFIGGYGTIGHSIVNLISQDSENTLYILKRHITEDLPKKDNIIYIQGNGKDEEFLSNIADKYNFDVVFNFIIFDPKEAKINIKAFKNKIKQFIFISTACVFNRDSSVLINEKTKKGNKYGNYGRLKLECENEFLKALKEFNFPITIVRPSQTYSRNRIPLSVKGSSCWPVIQRIIDGKEVIVHGDGKSTWVSTHSDDLAKGVYPLINNPLAIGEDFNITSDEILSWDQIYNTIGELLNKEVNIIHIPTDILKESKKYDFVTSILGDKQYSVIFDNSKIKSLNKDFHCDITLKEGLKKYLEFMDKHPELKIIDSDFQNWCDYLIKNYKKNIIQIGSF